jgi:hypothetical protein
VDFKKNMFLVVLGVIVLLALAAYVVLVPSINTETDNIMGECKDKADNLKNMADQSHQPDAIKTERHLELARAYNNALNDQLKQVKELLNRRQKMDLKFNDVPKPARDFDQWLDKLRGGIMSRVKDTAKINCKFDIEHELMFAGSLTDDATRDAKLHRDFRLRQMAIVEELMGVLCDTVVRQDVPDFSPEGADRTTSVALRVLELEKFKIDERARSSIEKQNWLADAYSRAKKGTSATPKGGAAAAVVELPYVYTPIELQFVAPLPVVPALLAALEKSDRFMLVITRVDLQRAESVFPQSLEAAEPNPKVNTYFLEGPVRALVNLDLYEYDKSKDKKLAEAK